MLIPKTSIEIASWSVSTALITFNLFYVVYNVGLSHLRVGMEMQAIAPILLYLIYCAGVLSIQKFATISIVVNVWRCCALCMAYFENGISTELALEIISTLVNTVTLLGYLQLISLSPMVMAVLFWAQIVMSFVRGFLLSYTNYKTAPVYKSLQIGSQLVCEAANIMDSAALNDERVVEQLQAKSDGIGTIINKLREYNDEKNALFFRSTKQEIDNFIKSYKQPVRS